MSNVYTPSYSRTSSSSAAAIAGPAVKRGHGAYSLGTFLGATFALLLAIPGTLMALPEDADQPIHIRADTVEYDQNGNRVIYRGSVQVDQGTLRVNAETMTIELEDGNKVVRITAVDTPARYQQQIEENEAPVKAQALTIVYHTQDERVDLKGQANLEQEGSTLTGDLIVYDIVAGRVDASAEQDNGPVTMVLQPDTAQQGQNPDSNAAPDDEQ